VPGDGRFEWNGYLPILAKPHTADPAQGYFATANNHLIPPDYPYPEAVGFEWSDPFRWLRAVEVLGSGRRFNLQDMMSLQTDELSIPARTLVPLLEELSSPDSLVERARRLLLQWDFVLDKRSVEAGIYVTWERRISARLTTLMVPDSLRRFLRAPSMIRQLDWLLTPGGEFGPSPLGNRDSLLMESLDEAVEELVTRFGQDASGWTYGQEGYKHILLEHPLSSAVNSAWRARLNVGPAPRGGYSYTLNATGRGDNQTSGASFRIIVDTGDWDRTLGMNNPGQGGHPDDPHYADLFSLWSQDRFHPVFFSRERVEGVTGQHVILRPGS
jgi:penicillin amidase